MIKVGSNNIGGIMFGPNHIGKIMYGANTVWQKLKFLTLWKLVGNSEVIGDQIMSCGDLGEDGKYHVLIKADSRVIDIPLDEPLRKVGTVGDTIEFPTDTPNTAIVTRKFIEADMGDWSWVYDNTYLRISSSGHDFKQTTSNRRLSTILTSNEYSVLSNGEGITGIDKACYTTTTGNFYLHDSNINSSDIINYKCSKLDGVTIVYEKETPTTSYISVPNIPLAKAYSSANKVQYSEFTYENPNALYIDGEPMTDEDGNEIVINIGRKTFNEL